MTLGFSEELKVGLNYHNGNTTGRLIHLNVFNLGEFRPSPPSRFLDRLSVGFKNVLSGDLREFLMIPMTYAFDGIPSSTKRLPGNPFTPLWRGAHKSLKSLKNFFAPLCLSASLDPDTPAVPVDPELATHPVTHSRVSNSYMTNMIYYDIMIMIILYIYDNKYIYIYIHIHIMDYHYFVSVPTHLNALKPTPDMPYSREAERQRGAIKKSNVFSHLQAPPQRGAKPSPERRHNEIQVKSIDNYHIFPCPNNQGMEVSVAC